MKLYCAALLLLSCAGPSFGKGAGEAALAFLKIDAGARPAAMGGAYAASGDDAFSVFYNPAGAAFIDRKEAAFTHHLWLEGMHQESFAYIHPLSRRLSLYGGFNILFSGDMQRLDAAGVSDGDDFGSREGAYFFGTSGLFSRSLFWGLALKGYSQNVDSEGTTAFGGDAGLLYHTGDFRLGASASNYGSKMKFGDYSFSLPFTWRAGAAKSILEQYWLTADWVDSPLGGGYACAGGEAEFELASTQAMFLRAGWSGQRPVNTGGGLTYGVGLRTHDLRLDYAFAPMGDLGASHRFSFTYSFGGIREKIPERSSYPRTYQPNKRNDPVSKRKKQAEEDEKIRRATFTW